CLSRKKSSKRARKSEQKQGKPKRSTPRLKKHKKHMPCRGKGSVSEREPIFCAKGMTGKNFLYKG
ncbi:MAG: hypothetical protein NC548_66115, partial [Lachnospiraceae bacterium]|nr:hypothetical protein [Lachnospiraceae bacterium]